MTITAKFSFFILILALSATGAGFSQTVTPLVDAPAIQNPDQKPAEPVPVPYGKDEFPQWVFDLRRAEIIFFGSLPITFLFAYQGVEIGRYYASGQNPDYAPWPFRSSSPVAYTAEEQWWIIGSAVAFSVTFAVIDFIINKSAASSSGEK